MADPRFFDNRGPFTLAQLCAEAGAPVPEGADASAAVHDVASLEGAGQGQLVFCANAKPALAALSDSSAGFCLIAENVDRGLAPAGMVLIAVKEPSAAFAAVARKFYPEHEQPVWSQQISVDPTASIGEDVILAPGVAIGPGVEIGARTRIGPNAVIGRGTAIGRDCTVGAGASISHAYLGDEVLVLPGARIGQSGFGFNSGAGGHRKIPQLGRVIVQDRVEVGANSTIDRGMLGDTVIGEGTKIDNLVHIGHNCRIGRHCMITGQVGMSGSVELGDFVIVGGQSAFADHAKVGDGARFAARSGVTPSNSYPGGADYGGAPARPIGQWRREVAAVAMLAKRRKKGKDD